MAKATTIGPYSRPTTLQKLDGRTRGARKASATRRALVKHCGGRPTPPQAMLIEQAIQLTLRLDALDSTFAVSGGFTVHDQNYYLAWSNSLRRLLVTLGLTTPKEEMSVDEILANIHRRTDDDDNEA